MVIQSREEAGGEFVAPSFNNDWYMRTYLVADQKRPRLDSRYVWHRGKVKKIAAASLIGMCAGMGAAAFHGQSTEARNAVLTVRQSAPIQAALPNTTTESTVTSSSSTAAKRRAPSSSKPDTHELGRLKARNRRLEALIVVLRQRTRVSESKSRVEQSAFLGQ